MIMKILIQSLFSIVIACIAFLITESTIIAGTIVLILFILIMIKPALMVLNKLIKRTNWYKIRVGDGLKFRENNLFNIDVCNLGSNSAKFAFFYEEFELTGINWAVGPQTLSYDFRVLKNYFSYLKEGATVLIPLCPFSSCIIDFVDESFNDKYYSFLHPILILNYSQNRKEKVMRFVNTPFQSSPLRAIIRLLKDVPVVANKTMEMDTLEEDSNKFINSWKQQFFISDLDAAVSENNLKSQIYNTNLLTEMISFCVDRTLKPILILPPVIKALSSKLSETFR